MLDGGQDEPGRAVADREDPAGEDDPLSAGQCADVLKTKELYQVHI